MFEGPDPVSASLSALTCGRLAGGGDGVAPGRTEQDSGLIKGKVAL